MADQSIPWAPRRKCLARRIDGGRWFEAIGVEHKGFSGHVSQRWLDDTGTALHLGAVMTAPLPGQCASCYEVGRHAEGCAGPAGLSPEEVAANIARGVPPLLAPWAMWEWPQPGGDVTFLALHGGWRPVVCYFDSLRQGWVGGLRSLGGIGHRDGIPLVAFGINGPTLAPWGRR